MPFLSRVLHPASKRKPPIQRQGSTPRPQCTAVPTAIRGSLHIHSEISPPRARKSGGTRTSSCHLPDNGSTMPSQMMRSFRINPGHAHQSRTATFADLCPVFRFILETKRYSRQSHILHQPHLHQHQHQHQHDQHRLHSTVANTHHLPRAETSVFITRSGTDRSSTSAFKGDCQCSSARHYYSREPASQHASHASHASHISLHSPSKRSCSSLLRSGSPRCTSSQQLGLNVNVVRQNLIPAGRRSISQHQQITRTLVEDVTVTDLRIPEEFLSIQPTPQVVLPPSAAVFKNWVVAQIAHARELFQKQNYMQALVVTDKAKEHDYMREFSRMHREGAPKTTNVTRKHLQDLHLVEFCCRLVCEHESRMGNIEITEIVETLEYLNKTTLQRLREMQPKTKGRARIEYRTTFQLYQDPLVDYTLAILTRSWNQLASAGGESLVASPASAAAQGLSSEQMALANAAVPFLKAITARGLFPSTTSILRDMATVSGSGADARRAVQEIFLSAGHQMSAMQWIWLWERRDRTDWLASQWNQLETRHWLVAQFLQSDRPEWSLDLFRLAGRAAGQPQLWIRDLTATISTIRSQQHPSSAREDLAAATALKEVLHLADLDATAFASKKQYYNLSSWSREDCLHSWLDGLQDAHPQLDQHYQHDNLSKHSVEQHLWREMAMVGVLSQVLTRQDVLRSVSPEIATAVSPSSTSLQHRPMDEVRGTSSGSILYRDTLTDYLEGKANKCLDSSLPRADQTQSRLRLDHSALEASSLLKRAIQEIMSPSRREGASADSLLAGYRDVLHDVAQHSAMRLGHMGLVSQVVEARFLALYGEGPWKETSSVARAGGQGAVNRHIHDSSWQASGMAAIPEVREFVAGHVRSTLARMCAFTRVDPENSAASPLGTVLSATKLEWEGRLSDWFMAMAETSMSAGPMARALQCQARVEPGSRAYEQAMWTLLEHRELDLAAALHSHVYGLIPIKGVNNASLKSPTSKELGRLVHGLVMSDVEPTHTELAQWITDQHLERGRVLAANAISDSEHSPQDSHGHQHSPQLMDIQVLTELAGAWSRRAEFSRTRHVVDIMFEQGIRPNMMFYNTLLKVLIDLTPHSKDGGRTMGSGKSSRMRELGREMMVRQLIQSQANGSSRGSMTVSRERVRSKLDEGWELFQRVVATASQQQSESASSAGTKDKGTLMDGNGLDAPLMLKRLITQTAPSSSLPGGNRSEMSFSAMDGQFRPDAYTFSILLSAFARRGEIESISELFVEMKELGLEPDVVICGILANAFAKKGDLKAVDRVIQEARIRNMDPGLYLANVVLDSLVEKGVSASRIRETLDGMIVGYGSGMMDMETRDLDDDAEIPVRRLGQNSHHHHDGSQRQHQQRQGWPSSGAVSSSVLSTGESGLDAVTLTTLIKYHTRQNDLRSAQDLLHLMVQAGFAPDGRVYVLLLAASIRKQDVSAGLDMIRAMRTRHSKEGAKETLLPDAKAWKGLLRCAMERELQEISGQDGQDGSRQQSSRGQFLSGFSGSPSSLDLGHNMHESSASQRRLAYQREQPVISVLRELSNVLDEIEKDTGKTGSASKDYLSEILTTSWLSLSSSKDNDHAKPHTSRSCVDGGIKSQVLNPEVKGRNGLLRRLLNHFLRDHIRTTEPSFDTDGPNSSESRCGNDVRMVSSESAAEIELRCEQAIWLVRLVERSGIELGPRWKWDIVVPRIQTLTGRNATVIVKQLGKKGKKSKL